MCFFGSPSGPSPPPMPSLPPPPPTPVDPQVSAARQRNKQVAALALGRNDTILTSAQGLTEPASTAKKTLLGE